MQVRALSTTRQYIFATPIVTSETTAATAQSAGWALPLVYNSTGGRQLHGTQACLIQHVDASRAACLPSILSAVLYSATTCNTPGIKATAIMHFVRGCRKSSSCSHMLQAIVALELYPNPHTCQYLCAREGHTHNAYCKAIHHQRSKIWHTPTPIKTLHFIQSGAPKQRLRPLQNTHTAPTTAALLHKHT